MKYRFENTFVHGSSPSFSDDATECLSTNLREPFSTNRNRSSDSLMIDKFHSIYSENFSEFLNSIPESKKRHTFAFWTVTLILLVLTIGNFLLTLTIIGVLRFGRGVSGLELIPEEDVIKFYGSTDLDRINIKMFNKIEGFTDQPVTISGDDNSVYVRLHRNGQNYNRIQIEKSGIQFRSINTFEIKDPASGGTIFSTHRPVFNMPTGTNTLITKVISGTKIESSLEEPLKFESDTHISIKGSEGISLDGLATSLQAEKNVLVNSTKNLIVQGGEGVYLNMDKVPIATSEFGLRTVSVQYKICICMPQGTLFRIAIPKKNNLYAKITCTHFDSINDPCVS